MWGCKPRFSATLISILSSTWISHIQFILPSSVQWTSQRKVMFWEYSDYPSHLWYVNWIKSHSRIYKTAILKIILLEFQPSYCLLLKCMKIYCSMQLQNMICIRVAYDNWNWKKKVSSASSFLQVFEKKGFWNTDKELRVQPSK